VTISDVIKRNCTTYIAHYGLAVKTIHKLVQQTAEKIRRHNKHNPLRIRIHELHGDASTHRRQMRAFSKQETAKLLSTTIRLKIHRCTYTCRLYSITVWTCSLFVEQNPISGNFSAPSVRAVLPRLPYTLTHRLIAVVASRQRTMTSQNFDG
jgi:hypothetical protein